MALATQIRDLVEGVGALLAEHLELARIELKEDARYVGVRVGLIAALAPLILVGYGFLCIAAALALGRVVSVELGFVIVGAANLLIGGVGVALIGRQLGARKVLDSTTAELATTRATVLHRKDGAA